MPATILLVEPDHACRDVYSTYFAHLGYEIATASTGRDGLDRAREMRPDVVVIEIGLPDADGFDVVRRLKEDFATTEITIVALTAYARRTDRARCLEAGCDLYLAKPVAPTALRVAIDGLLAEPA
jgi:two-component system, cell cycle response regulator DivK